MTTGNDFYVGYLPAPARLRRALRTVLPLILGALAGAGVMLARTQPDPGPAVWDDANPRSFSGSLAGGPYPVLFIPNADGTTTPALVVAPGKHGAAARLAPLADRAVTLRGTALRRGSALMIELDEADDAAAPAATVAGAPGLPAVKPMGRATLRGEIVDTKCYLGAMKPGSGRPHKECATLCISGGVPPCLLYRDEQGNPHTALLLDPSGGPLSQDAFPFIADPVEVVGDLEEQGGLLRLRVSPANITRL